MGLSQLVPGNDLICGALIGPLWLANKFNYLNERCSGILEEADNNTLVHQNNYLQLQLPFHGYQNLDFPQEFAQ